MLASADRQRSHIPGGTAPAGSAERAARMKKHRRQPNRLPPLPDRDAVRRAATARLEEIAAHVWPDDVHVRRAGSSIRYGTKGARVVHVEGPMAGRYADWEAGHHGDVFDLWARAALGLASAAQDFPRVLRDLAGFLGVGAEDKRCPSDRMKEPSQADGRRVREAARLTANTVAIRLMVEAAGPVEGSIAMHYLARRGLKRTGNVHDLRFLPARSVTREALAGLYAEAETNPPAWLDLPALLCLARDGTGCITGVQRILLSKDGGAKARTPVPKPATGRLAGAALHLGRAEGRGAADPILIAEGPETALSLWQATGFETRAVLGGFSGDIPLPEPGPPVLLCHDADPPGSPAEDARAAAIAALRSAGHDVRPVAPPGAKHDGWDFNDVLRDASLGEEAIRSAVRAVLAQSARHPAKGHLV
ncbi:MAG: toprim domain-containing protein [Paracoccaceae bacterium]